MTSLRRLRTAVGALLLAGALAGCGTAVSARHPHPVTDEAMMPVAPPTDAAWLAQVDHIYDSSGTHGTSAEDWLRDRAAHRRPGERLAVVMGIDDVMLQTHFAGLAAPVPPSTQFVRLAHQLGYAVFYVTGRPDGSTGLAQAATALRRAHVPIDGICGRPPGDTEAQGKAACRGVIEQRGYTIAMVVAASEASFDGSPSPERAVHLPAFV